MLQNEQICMIIQQVVVRIKRISRWLRLKKHPKLDRLLFGNNGPKNALRKLYRSNASMKLPVTFMSMSPNSFSTSAKRSNADLSLRCQCFMQAILYQ